MVADEEALRDVPRFPHELLHDMRQRRQAIPPRATVIGNYVRTPGRVGKPATQEELAEALAISREWYCTLENGRCAEISVELASKIAHLLYDRRMARQLRAGIQEGSVVSIADMRRYVQRVAAASTYFDAAVEAMETGARLLAVDCVSVINFEETGSIRGRAVGRRSRYLEAVVRPRRSRRAPRAPRRRRRGQRMRSDGRRGRPRPLSPYVFRVAVFGTQRLRI